MDKRLQMLSYFIGIADKQGDAVWAALFRELYLQVEKDSGKPITKLHIEGTPV